MAVVFSDRDDQSAVAEHLGGVWDGQTFKIHHSTYALWVRDYMISFIAGGHGGVGLGNDAIVQANATYDKVQQFLSSM